MAWLWGQIKCWGCSWQIIIIASEYQQTFAHVEINWWNPCSSSFYFVLCCAIMCLYVLSSVLWCPLRFPHKAMLGLSLLPVVCRRVHVLFALIVFFAYSGVQHILCCVFLHIMYPMLTVSLDCPFLIVPSVFSNAYVAWQVRQSDAKQ